MQGVMITNGGPHSAARWAEATASHIVDIAEHVSGEKRGAAIKLQAAIIDILETHHAAVQTGERTKLKEVGCDRLNCELHSHDHVTAEHIADDIIAAASGTPWEKDFQFAGQEEQTLADGTYIPAVNSMHKNLCDLLTHHFRTSMHIERSWHADRNPADPQAQEFHTNHNLREGGAA